jgi:hypothetical protein
VVDNRNMGMYSALDDLVQLIKDEMTNGYDVQVDKIWEQKSVGFIDDRRDRILVYPKNEDVKPFGLYGCDWLHITDLNVEIRSYGDQERLSNIINDISKIIKTNIRRDNFIDIMITGSITESDKMRNMFKHILTVRYRKHNP